MRNDDTAKTSVDKLLKGIEDHRRNTSRFRIDVAPWHAAKQRAIAAHASQMTDLIDDDPEGFRFTPETIAPFLADVETIFEMPT